MSNTQNVSVAKPRIGGAAYTAPLGTELPTDAITKLDTEKFKALGYISEDGLTNTNTPDSDVIKGWGGDTVAVISNGKEDTFQYTLIETLNVDVLKEVYGEDNVTGDLKTGISVVANNDEYQPHVLVFDMTLKNGIFKRIIIPNGTISEVGDITYKDDEAIGYETSLTAAAVESVNKAGKTINSTHYEYIQDPKTGEVTENA